MLKSKKLAKACVLGVLATLGLCACDEVYAKPSDYNEKIVTVDTYNEEIYNDIMSVIYDQIHNSSDFGKEVLNEILFEYATSVIGKYNVVIKDSRSNASKDTISLKAAAEDIKRLGSDYAKAEKFVNEHKAYWSINPNTGKRYVEGEDGYQVAHAQEFSRVTAKWQTIEDRIAETMYKKFKEGSFSDRNMYSEEMFLRNLDLSLGKVENPYSASFTRKGYIIFLEPSVEPKEVFTKGKLTRKFYQSSSEQIQDVGPAPGVTWNTYIEDNIIPDIYRQLLVEQYLVDKSYNTLGGAFARRVNVLAIKDNDKYPNAAQSLMKKVAVDLVEEAPAGTELPKDLEDNNFSKEILEYMNATSKLWTGVDLTAEEDAILEDLAKNGGFTKKTVKGTTYWAGTEYGDMLDNYFKITTDTKTNDPTIESDFNGGGAYTIETGKEIKTNELRTKSHTTTGWFIKNGGLTNLPAEIRDRLFSVGVSNSLDIPIVGGVRPTVYDRWQYENGSWNYDKTRDYNSYVARIGSKYFLKNDKIPAESDQSDILFYDVATKTNYIIQIVEAVTPSKLNKSSTKNYAAIRSSDKMEEIVNNVLKVVGTGESYATTSTKYWLEQAGIKYHDQKVYNYFKTNYPELFN